MLIFICLSQKKNVLSITHLNFPSLNQTEVFSEEEGNESRLLKMEKGSIM